MKIWGKIMKNTHKNGHNLEIYIIPMLKNLGYKEKDIHEIKDQSTPPYPNPDYIIEEKGIRIAVEVGTLSRKTKIKDLLVEFKKVIWIFSDKDLPFLNCVIYHSGDYKTEDEREEVLKKRYERRIEDLRDKVIELKGIEREKDERNKTNKNKLKAIESILNSSCSKEEILDFNIRSNLSQREKDKESKNFGYYKEIGSKLEYGCGRDIILETDEILHKLNEEEINKHKI